MALSSVSWKYILIMNVLSNFLLNNARNPKGLLGMSILEFMNGFSHKNLAEWAFPFMEIKDGDCILDIGCGGGGNVSRLLKKYPVSVVKGVDYSPISVALSKWHNAKEIADNRCQILEGNVRSLPCESSSFNIVTAFETVYYWPEIEKSFKEVLRVLKEDGLFYIINGADAEGGWVWDQYIEKMHTYTSLELETHLISSGFEDVEIIRNKDYHFLCVIAHKYNKSNNYNNN